jgi:hypothetical protein
MRPAFSVVIRDHSKPGAGTFSLSFCQYSFIDSPPLFFRAFSESISLENKRDEEGIENLHPPMYHIVRLERQLTQKEDANATSSSFPQGIH